MSLTSEDLKPRFANFLKRANDTLGLEIKPETIDAAVEFVFTPPSSAPDADEHPKKKPGDEDEADVPSPISQLVRDMDLYASHMVNSEEPRYLVAATIRGFAARVRQLEDFDEH